MSRFNIVPLNVAKELKKNGWHQLSEFSYFHNDLDGNYYPAYSESHRENGVVQPLEAPTLEEIIWQLPKNIKGKYLTITWDDYAWVAGYSPGMFKEGGWAMVATGKTQQPLIEVIAQLWIGLRKTNSLLF